MNVLRFHLFGKKRLARTIRTRARFFATFYFGARTTAFLATDASSEGLERASRAGCSERWSVCSLDGRASGERGV